MLSMLLYSLIIQFIFFSSSSSIKLQQSSHMECKEMQQPLIENHHKNGIEYLFFSERVTWEEAKMICKNYESTLTILNTKEKSLIVAQLLSESNIEINDAWIGGRRVNFVWYWIDKDIEPWQSIISMIPNIEDYPPWRRAPTRSTKECLAIDRRFHQNASFIDLDCWLLKSFICEKRSKDFVNNPMPSKSVLINKSTFILYNGKVTWQEAAMFCREKGFRLAIVKNLITTHLLANTMTKSRPDFEKMWIGAHFSYGQWIWLATGITLNTFTNESGFPPWRFGRPEEHDGCLLLDKHIELNSTFISTSCNYKRDFICEKYPEDDYNDWLNEPTKFTYNNNTYIIYPMDKTWFESDTFCNERGSILAYIEQSHTIDLIINAMGDHPREISHIWLGAKYDNILSKWFWQKNGKNIKSIHETLPWIEIEGENGVIKQNISYCLNLDRADNVKPYFYGLDCYSKQPFLCQISCNISPMVDNGFWNCSDSTDSRLCHVQCNQGYLLMGINNITCTAKNGWISGANSMEFPLCLNPINYYTKLMEAISQNIQQSSAYYLLYYHSSSVVKSFAFNFIELLFSAFPASDYLKVGITAYVKDPPVHLPFNQTLSCSVIRNLHIAENLTDKAMNITPDVHGFFQEVSNYDGRIISIIAIIDSEHGLQYRDALLHFKSSGHYITIIGLRNHVNMLLPLATVGLNRRLNLYLFNEDELQIFINHIEKYGIKSECLNFEENAPDPFNQIKMYGVTTTSPIISHINSSETTKIPTWPSTTETVISPTINEPSSTSENVIIPTTVTESEYDLF